MSITVSSLGASSSSLSYGADTTEQEIHDALVTALEGYGWTQYDAHTDVGGADPSTVMVALCADGTSPKYLQVRVTTSYVFMEVWEDWDNVAHNGTNRAYHSDNSSYAQRLTLATGGLIYVFATVRYAFIQSVTSANAIGSSTGSGFCGICEVSRDNSEEVPGDAPIYVWLNSYLFAGGANTGDTNTDLYSYPRTPLALGNYSGQTACDRSHTTSIFGASYGGRRAYNDAPHNPNPLSVSGHNFVATLNSVYLEPEWYMRGRFYGIKQLATNIGMNMDTIRMRVDTELFFDPNGTNIRDHYVLSGAARYALPA